MEIQLSEKQIKDIFKQMLESMQYCHSQNIVHRDVKLENFLIDTDEDGELIVKLSDFGIACVYDCENPPTTKCGSLLAVAPELLSN